MDLLNSVLGGVGQAGEALDKFTGGRALRGLAAGKPRELLSALPFSDTMGLTDEHDASSGRDVTDTWGLTNKGDNSFGSSAAGFGADMLLNPLALTGAGAAAKAAPTLGKGIVAGAKALSGADLLESLGGKLKGAAGGLGKLAASDSGALDLGAFAGRRAGAGFAPKAVDAAPASMGGEAVQAVDQTWGLNSNGYNATNAGLLDSLGTPQQQGWRHFLGSESGAAAIPIPEPHFNGKTPPNPINVEARNNPGLSLEAQSMNPRRFSEDPAKKQWYARHRTERSFRPDSLAGQLGKFLKDERGSLNLNFDRWGRAEDAGLLRADPEWVNNRTFYHGTGTPNLKGDMLDPLKTDPGAMYRRGIYTTDEGGRAGNEITKGYAEDRTKTLSAKLTSDMFGADNVENAIREGKLSLSDVQSAMRTYGSADRDIAYAMPGVDPRLIAARARFPLERMIDRIGDTSKDPHAQRIVDALGGIRRAEPTIYEAQSSFNKIMDMDQRNPELQRALYEALQGRGIGGSISRPEDFSSLGELFQSGVHEGDVPSIRAIQALKGDLGYDALTHTGGLNTGNDYHQVVIGLDPNDKLGLGRATPYKQWGPIGQIPPSVPVPPLSADALAGFRSRRPASLLSMLGTGG